jgi:hypothetical protein
MDPSIDDEITKCINSIQIKTLEIRTDFVFVYTINIVAYSSCSALEDFNSSQQYCSTNWNVLREGADFWQLHSALQKLCEKYRIQNSKRNSDEATIIRFSTHPSPTLSLNLPHSPRMSLGGLPRRNSGRHLPALPAQIFNNKHSSHHTIDPVSYCLIMQQFIVDLIMFSRSLLFRLKSSDQLSREVNNTFKTFFAPRNRKTKAELDRERIQPSRVLRIHKNFIDATTLSSSHTTFGDDRKTSSIGTLPTVDGTTQTLIPFDDDFKDIL